jgi:hypothetical protein
MKQKFSEIVKANVKDFGLTDKAIEDLIATSIEGINEKTTEEELKKMADSLTPFAKLMQAEITRKAQSIKAKKEPTPPMEKKEDTQQTNKSEEEPDWFKNYKIEQEKTISALKNENEKFRQERASAERDRVISETAKRLGIPHFLMKSYKIEDDADVEQNLLAFKQELVTNSLLPKEAPLPATQEKAMIEEAKKWAASLPDNN